MERHVQRLTLPTASRQARLRLASVDGQVRRPPQVAPVDGPELPMLVRFEGLTEAEQRAALAAFPGGSRFVLAS
jgi:hypothetical protein